MNMTKLLTLYSVLLSSVFSWAQLSTVTATVQDPSGQTFNNGTYSVSFVTAPNQPNPNAYNVNGASFPQGPFVGSLSSGGAISINLTRNDLISPSGSQWSFTFCPNAQFPCSQLNIPIQGGASQDISSTFNAVVPTISISAAPLINRAYKQAEAKTPPQDGGVFFDVTQGKLCAWWSGSWTCFGAPGAGTPQGPLNSVQINAGSGNFTGYANFEYDGNILTVPTVKATYVNANNIIDAGSYPGADPCAKYTNAEVDAVVGTTTIIVPSGTCAATLSNTKSVTIQIQGTLTLNGNPGISITAPNVAIIGNSSVSPYQHSTGGTLVSGTAGPLIANLVSNAVSLHLADGTTIKNLELNGNSIGTIGVFTPTAFNVKEDNITIHDFTSVGNFVDGLQGSYNNVIVSNIGQDCWVVGGDSHIQGLSQANGCTNGDGYHVLTGGTVLDGVIGYECGYNCGAEDGSAGGDWSAGVTYLEPSAIRPLTANAGSYTYYTLITGTTAGAHPVWCQNVGCTVTDGTVTWINFGTNPGYALGGNDLGQAIWAVWNNPNFSEAGQANQAGLWCDLIIRASQGSFTNQNQIRGAIFRQTQSSGPGDNPAAGICISDSSQVTISGYQFYGNSGVGFRQNDLGALNINGSFFINVEGMTTNNTFGPAIYVNNSRGAYFTDTQISNTGASGDSIYPVQITASAINVDFKGLSIRDDRGSPFSKGFQNLAGNDHNIRVSDYVAEGLVSTPNSWGNTVIYNSPGAVQGTGFFGGIKFAEFGNAVLGSEFVCPDCVAGSNPCIAGGSGAWVTVPVNGTFLCGSSGGGGGVTSFSASGSLGPLYTYVVSTPTTTPLLTFLQTNLAADNIVGNFTAGSAPATTQTIPPCANDGLHSLTYVGHILTCTSITAGTITASAQFNDTYYSGAGTSSTLNGDNGAGTDGSGNKFANSLSLNSAWNGLWSWAVGTGNQPALPANSGGFTITDGAFTSYVIGLPAGIAAGMPLFGTPGTVHNVNTAAMTVIPPSGVKCYPFMGSGGSGCDSGTGGVNTATSPLDISGTTVREKVYLSGTDTGTANHYNLASPTVGTCPASHAAILLNTEVAFIPANNQTSLTPDLDICGFGSPDTIASNSGGSLASGDMATIGISVVKWTGTKWQLLTRITTNGTVVNSTAPVQNYNAKWNSNIVPAQAVGSILDTGTNVTPGAVSTASSFSAATYKSATNCQSAASPAVCSAAPAGMVVIAASANTVVVNTTAVTANSEISITFDTTLGTALSVTCNGTYAPPWISARTAGTSFTISTSLAPVTNPACYTYRIIN